MCIHLFFLYFKVSRTILFLQYADIYLLRLFVLVNPKHVGAESNLILSQNLIAIRPIVEYLKTFWNICPLSETGLLVGRCFVKA